MNKGQCKNTINKSQGNITPSDHSYTTSASSGYPNTTKAYKNDLNSNLTKIAQAFTEEMNKSLKEIQENTFKEIEAFKEETNKPLNERQKNTIK
jgi:DNA anti-recombination protein RmuC